jgi:hypothetical protein
MAGFFYQFSRAPLPCLAALLSSHIIVRDVSSLAKCSISAFSRARPKMMCMFACDQDSECVSGTHTFSFHDLLAVAQFFAFFLSFEKRKVKKKRKMCENLRHSQKFMK